MKGMMFVAFVLACLLAGSGCMTGDDTSYNRDQGPKADSLALTSHDIITMSKAKVGDDVIVHLIRTTDSYFHLRSRDVVELADSGVSDKVIEAMIKTAEAPREQGARPYYYVPYYPTYWYGAYPYWYPWSFGLSVGYYSPVYHRGYVVPHYGYGAPHHYYAGHASYGGHSSGGGRSSGGGSRTSGRRR